MSTTKSKIKSEFHGAGKIGQYVVVSIWESYRVCAIRVDLEWAVTQKTRERDLR